jgi:hypothetical protein
MKRKLATLINESAARGAPQKAFHLDWLGPRLYRILNGVASPDQEASHTGRTELQFSGCYLADRTIGAALRQALR